MKREVWQHECGTIEDNQGNLYLAEIEAEEAAAIATAEAQK